MLHISSPFLMGCCFFTLETDFDECQASDLNECHEKAKCTNTLGSYNCTCLDGYFGDGVLCQGVFWYQSGVITVLWYSRVNVVEKFSSLWEVMIKKGLEIKDLPLTIWLFIQEWTTWPTQHDMTGQHDRQVKFLARQVTILARHCPLTSHFFWVLNIHQSNRSYIYICSCCVTKTLHLWLEGTGCQRM